MRTSFYNIIPPGQFSVNLFVVVSPLVFPTGPISLSHGFFRKSLHFLPVFHLDAVTTECYTVSESVFRIKPNMGGAL